MSAALRTGMGVSPRPLAAGLVGGWRYLGGVRDERLDLLRGFAVVAMVVDHIGGASSWLYAITGGGHFAVSAAEVFVLIAGLTMGMVYPRLIATRGQAAAVAKALRRAALLYLLTVSLTLAFAGASALLTQPWAPALDSRGMPGWVLDVVLLRRTFYLTDIILMYAVVIAAAAPLLVLLARGYTRAVLAGSFLLWAAWQLAPGSVHVPWRIQDNDLFVIAAWQIVFVAGLTLGFHRRRLEAMLARVQPAAVLSVTALAFALAALAVTTGGVAHDQLARRADVPFARLAMLAVAFSFAYAAATVCWRPLRGATGWLLLPLGQHALFAYVTHLAVVVLLGWLLPTWDVARSPGETALIQAAGTMLVWCAVLTLPHVEALARWVTRAEVALVAAPGFTERAA